MTEIRNFLYGVHAFSPFPSSNQNLVLFMRCILILHFVMRFEHPSEAENSPKRNIFVDDDRM